MVAAKKMSGTTAYYQYPHYDHRGSVATLTDKSGVVVASYFYDAWSNLLNATESAATQAVGNRFQYQSNWMTLKDSGGTVCLSPTRLYVPGIGRFIQKDPLWKISFLTHAFSFSIQTPSHFIYTGRGPNYLTSIEIPNIYRAIPMLPSSGTQFESALLFFKSYENLFIFVQNIPSIFTDNYGLTGGWGDPVGTKKNVYGTWDIFRGSSAMGQGYWYSLDAADGRRVLDTIP